MEIKILRKVSTNTGFKVLNEPCEGLMYLDGAFFANTLEKPNRFLSSIGSINYLSDNIVSNNTAIPYGKYPVLMMYSDRLDKELPLVDGVKCFTGVRFVALQSEASGGDIVVDRHDDLMQRINDALRRQERVELIVDAVFV